MPFEPIAPQRLYRRIADQIAGLIDAGELPPGSRLPAERELARRLAVSRPSLREALIALEIEGRVEVRGGSGIYVARLGRGSTTCEPEAAGPFEVLEARLLLEPSCAALAARRADAGGRAAVAAAFDRFAAAVAAGQFHLGIDRAFHEAIASATGNAMLFRLVVALWEAQTAQLARRLSALAVSDTGRKDLLEEHRAIAVAISVGDAHAARMAMRRHLLAVRRARLAMLRSANDLHAKRKASLPTNRKYR